MASSHQANRLLGVNLQQKLGELHVCMCGSVRNERDVCVLTFQSMVEKKAWRLISSTPSGPAPKDTDHLVQFTGTPVFIVLRGSTRSNIFSLSGFHHVI